MSAYLRDFMYLKFARCDLGRKRDCGHAHPHNTGHRCRQGRLQRRFWDVIRVARLPVDPCCLSHALLVPLCALCLALLPSASRIVVLFEQTSLIRLSFFVLLFRFSSLCLRPLFVLLLSSPCSFPGSPSCSFSFLSFSALSSSLLQKLFFWVA